MSRIEEYKREIGGYLLQRLMDVPGFTVLGPQSSEEGGTLIEAFVCDGVHPIVDLGMFLDMEGLAVRTEHPCCQPLYSAVGVSHSVKDRL